MLHKNKPKCVHKCVLHSIADYTVFQPRVHYHSYTHVYTLSDACEMHNVDLYMQAYELIQALTLTGEVTMWTFDRIDMSSGVFSKQSLIGKALEAEATCVVGITCWFSLSVQVVLQLRVVRE